MTCVTRMKPVEWHALAFALVDLCMRLSWRSAIQGIPPFMTSHRAIQKKLSKNLLKPLFHRNYLEQFVPELFPLELFFPADLSAFPSRSKAGVFNLWGAPPLAAHCPRCVFTVCVFVCSLLTAVYVHLDGWNAEHKFPVWDTILGHMSRPFLSFFI